MHIFAFFTALQETKCVISAYEIGIVLIRKKIALRNETGSCEVIR